MGLIIGGVPPHGLILDGQSASLYVGGSPPVKVWPTIREVVQITLGTGLEARTQLRDALSARGLSHSTVTEIPFDIELVGTGSALQMFYNCQALTKAPAMDTSGVTSMEQMFWACSSLTTVPNMDTSGVTSMSRMFRECSSLTQVPEMDTSQVTDMYGMFHSCYSLTSVPDMDTSQVTDAQYMFYYCNKLTDGNVRLIGRNPSVNTGNMITGSGLTREPFFHPDGTPDDGIEVHKVSLTDVYGEGTVHPLLTVTVPAGETWSVRVQGTMQSSYPTDFPLDPQIRIGSSTSSRYGNGATVDYSGTITSSDSTIALVTAEESLYGSAGFTGTVTIEK